MTFTPQAPDLPNWADTMSAWSGFAEAILVGATFFASLVAVNYTRKTWQQAEADENRRRDVEAYNIKVFAQALPEDAGSTTELGRLAETVGRDAGWLPPHFYVMVHNSGPHPIRNLEVRLGRQPQNDAWREVVEGALGRQEHVTDLAGHTKAYFVRRGTYSRDTYDPVTVSFEDQYGQRWTIDDKGRRAKAAADSAPTL